MACWVLVFYCTFLVHYYSLCRALRKPRIKKYAFHSAPPSLKKCASLPSPHPLRPKKRRFHARFHASSRSASSISIACASLPLKPHMPPAQPPTAPPSPLPPLPPMPPLPPLPPLLPSPPAASSCTPPSARVRGETPSSVSLKPPIRESETADTLKKRCLPGRASGKQP